MVMDYEGIKALLDRAKGLFPRLAHLWMDAGYRGEAKGADWGKRRWLDGRDRQQTRKPARRMAWRGLGRV